MNYDFRTTYRQDADSYVEDRGCPFYVRRGDADFGAVDEQFGPMLFPGQTAVRSGDGDDGWEIVDGCPMLEERRAAKLAELTEKWLAAERNGVVHSAAGFDIDATDRSNRDVAGLIAAMEATGAAEAEFCAADNSFHSVTLGQLRTMQLEIIRFAQSLYARKWSLRGAIGGASTFADLDAVDISFEDL